MSMDATTWSRVAALFDELSQEPAERRKERLAAADPEIRSWLERLLQAHDADQPWFLDEVLDDVVERMLAEDDERLEVMPADPVGMQFGSWRAEDEIDRGGMGVVLRGVRADGQFEKEVAIKLLPPGPVGPEVRARFQSEIRALARLEHPNIAHLIDGGINDDGMPYLVMEYVRGRPLDHYCRESGLGRRRRIALFRQLVAAVSFCHRHLIVHGDIKPANVLVTSDGLVKLVDFGVGTILPESGQHRERPPGARCSPAYAAPERLRGDAPAIPQDVFALGAVLHELLTGERLRDGRSRTALVLAGEDPEPTLPSMAALPRDLAAICRRALAADPGARYHSADAMDADLSASLQHRPVAARGGGRMYRAGRWFRRHWLPAAAIGATAAALLAGTGMALWQAREAHRQAEAALASSQRADLVRDFLVELFDASNPDRTGGNVPDARELLDAGTIRARVAFPDAPLLRAELLYTLARIHRKLGGMDTAGELLDSAMRDLGPEQVDLRWRVYNQQAALALNRGDAGRALTILDRAAGELEGALDPRARDYLDITRIQALQRIDGSTRAAVRLGREVLARPRIQRGDSPVSVLAHSTVLGLQVMAGRLEEALELGAEAARLAATEHASPSRRIAIYNNLASAHRRAGDRPAAIELRRRALALARGAFPEPHFQRAYVAASLGGNLAMVGQFEEARELLDAALAEYEQIYAEPNLRTAAAHSNLGLLLSLQERHAEAVSHFQVMVDVYSEQLGADHPQTLVARANRASTLSRMGHEAAEAELTAVLRVRREQFGASHPAVFRSRSVLVRHYLDNGQPGQALEQIDDLLAAMRREFPDGHHRIYSVMTYRAAALGRLGRVDEASEAFDAVIAGIGETGPASRLHYLEMLDRYSRFLALHAPGRMDADLMPLLDDPDWLRFQAHPAWQRIQRRIEEARRVAGRSA